MRLKAPLRRMILADQCSWSELMTSLVIKPRVQMSRLGIIDMKSAHVSGLPD